MKRFLPWIILAIAVGSIAASWMPPKAAKADFDFRRFGETAGHCCAKFAPDHSWETGSPARRRQAIERNAMAYRCPLQCSRRR
jgi:hypothetical protein